MPHRGDYGAKRQMPKKRAPRDTTVGHRTTEMAAGFEHARRMGVGVEPGAREVKSPPIANPIEQIARLFRKRKSAK